MQKNLDVRKKIKTYGLRQWQVAKRYGLHEGNFSRMLREELPEDIKVRIFQIIEQLKGEAV